jgi:hypothetical protein
MTYSEMVTLLKSTIPEDNNGATGIMLLELIQHLQAGSKKPDAKLGELSSALNKHLIACAQLQWSVLSYFQGDGPIARKLRDYNAISRHFTIGSYKLEDTLKKFDFKAYWDEAEKGSTFREWLEDIAENAFGQSHDIDMPLPYTPGIEIGLDTGVHSQITSYADVEPLRILVLSAELKNGLAVKYVVRRHQRAILLYWHPFEEVWLADGGSVIIPGVREALEVEWAKIAGEVGYSSKPVDIEANVEEINRKVELIFDNEDKLPQISTYYIRKDQYESYLRFQIGDYQLNFMNTKGQWPSRSMSLSINLGGAGNSRIEFTDMREFARQEIFNRVQKGLDELIAQFLTPAQEAAPEPAEEVQQPAEQSSTPNYNPVWKAMHGVVKGKK